VTATLPEAPVQEAPTEPEVDRHTLSILDHTGDTRIEWNPADETEVAIARAAFEKGKAERRLAYRVTDEGGNGEVMREFDPEARAIVMAPQTVGG